MSKLKLHDEHGQLISERQLDRERVKIGRRADCDIQLDHHAVSGEHALISTIRNDSFLQDLGSTNGVRVNGKLVKNHHLQDGDEIHIAIFKFKFQFEAWIMPDCSWAPTVTRTFNQPNLSDANVNDETLLEIGSNDSAGLLRNIDSNRMFDTFVVKQEHFNNPTNENRTGVLRLKAGPAAANN